MSAFGGIIDLFHRPAVGSHCCLCTPLVLLLEGRGLDGDREAQRLTHRGPGCPGPQRPSTFPPLSRAVGPLEPQGLRVSAAGTRAQQLGVSGPQSGFGDGGWWQQLTRPLGPEPPCLGSKVPRSPWHPRGAAGAEPQAWRPRGEGAWRSSA